MFTNSKQKRKRKPLFSMAFMAFGLALSPMGLALQADIENPLTSEGSWVELEGDFLDDPQNVKNGGEIFHMDAPIRAEDAALVPIRFYQTNPDENIETAMLIIDENPAPLAAEFTFGEAMQPVDMETRIRVNQYSNVRLIAKTEDGIFMDGRYVKASGGCSAPASKDPSEALADLGKMRLRDFDETGDAQGAVSTPRRNAQIMIRHPNNSGLQRDQVTQLFVPAFFINRLDVYQGDELLFTMDGGISISENPSFRFAYNDNGSTSFRVVATDTDGNSFEHVLDKAALDQS